MLDFLGSMAGTLAAFIAVLALVIVIHELGHFSVAKLFGVRIDRFSIGFGKNRQVGRGVAARRPAAGRLRQVLG